MEDVKKFTKQQIKNWRSFEKIRQGGRFNMFDPNARAMSSMTREEWAFCMKHYDDLKAQSASEIRPSNH